MCFAGLKYMLLMCYVKEPFASSLATLAAVIHYLHSVGLEQILGRYGLVSSFRLQKLTEIAYVGLILKLASDIDAGMGLNFWATSFGK